MSKQNLKWNKIILVVDYSMKIWFKKGIKACRGGFCRERKHKHKSVTHKAVQRSHRKSLYRIGKKLISAAKSKTIQKANRESRISTEYDAFCKAKLPKITPKIINKRKRRTDFEASREHFIHSIVNRTISRVIHHFESHNQCIYDTPVADTFAIVIDAILSELKDSENCELCCIECTLFGLKRDNVKRILPLFKEIIPQTVFALFTEIFMENQNQSKLNSEVKEEMSKL